MNVSMTSPILLMMRGHENPCELLITPEMAKEICANWMYEQQRPLYKKNVEHLRESMNAREWKRGSTITFTSDGYCVNGQHRMWALSEAEVACWFIVFVSDDRDEDLYVVQDCGRSRSIADTLPNDVKNRSNTSGIIRGILNYREHGFGPKFFTDTPQPYEPRRYYEAHKAEIDDVSAASVSMNKNYVFCSPKTLGFVFWLTQQIDPETARTFRDGIAGTGDAAWIYTKLSRWVIGKTRAQGARVRDYIYIRALASLWNALVDGKPLERISVNQDNPIKFKDMETVSFE